MTEKEIIQKIYEVIKLVDCIQYNPSVDFNYLRAKGAYNIIKNQVEHIEAENAALRERLEKAVILPCKVGDTIYEATPVGIREWLVTSIELEDYGFKANCEGKNDFKLHWHFVKTDCCNDFEGKGRIRVTREAAEARCAELKGGKE